MIVIDASALVELLLGTERGRAVGDRLLGGLPRHAPHLLDAEIAQTVRRLVRQKVVTQDRGKQCIEDLLAFPIRRHGHLALLERIYELRDRLSAYDAAYLALAEALNATLITFDGALARTPGRMAAVELMT